MIVRLGPRFSSYLSNLFLEFLSSRVSSKKKEKTKENTRDDVWLTPNLNIMIHRVRIEEGRENSSEMRKKKKKKKRKDTDRLSTTGLLRLYTNDEKETNISTHVFFSPPWNWSERRLVVDSLSGRLDDS